MNPRIDPLRVFIGYDEREAVGYHVLANSILSTAKAPVSVTPLHLNNLMGLYTRRWNSQSTAFSFTRFLVPYLCGYRGWALFLDGDMLVRHDLTKIMNYVDMAAYRHDVLVCKHDYAPKRTTKFLNNRQTIYPKKNWSSVMLFNNRRCEALTPEYVNTRPASELHQMHWARSIGELPLEWNWLVGEYKYNDKAQIAHFTNGLPCFPEYRECDYALEWFNERQRTLAGDDNAGI